MKTNASSARSGFTIVELLIVIIVIGILAALVLLAYSNVTKQAKVSTVQGDLAQAAKQLGQDREQNGGSTYPASLAAAASGNGLRPSANGTYTYYPNAATSPTGYCLEETRDDVSYYTAYAPSTGFQSGAGKCLTSYGVSGLWYMNGSGSDASTKNATLSTVNLTQVAGQSGASNGAFSFDGSTSYMSGTVDTAPVANVTVTCWAYITLNSTKGTLIHIGQGNGYSLGFGGYFSSASNRAFVLFPNVRWIPIDPITISTTGWHFFVMTLDANSTPTVYIDGVLDVSAPGVAPAAASKAVSIGRNIGDEGANQAERSFNSSIDDARYYTRALGQPEISALYAAGAQ